MKFPACFRDANSPFYFEPALFTGWKKERKSKLFIIIVFLLLILFYLSFQVFHLFYYNTTTSATRGLYMAVPFSTLERGDFAIVECPKDYPPLAKKGTLLLKRVEGLPGDTFQVNTDTLNILGQEYPIYHIASYLPQLPLGKYEVPEDMYLFLNVMPYSFDSRYMGPIPKTRVLKKVVLVFNSDHALQVMENIRKELAS